ncbi:MAG: hypothetical protein ACTSSB_10490 [Candidatus Heimdallarchaeota archaeon]
MLLREGIFKIIEEYKFLTEKVDGIKKDLVICDRYGYRVKKTKYCSNCNAPLQDIKAKHIEFKIKRTTQIRNNFEALIESIKDDLSEADLKTSNELKSILEQLFDVQRKLHTYLIDIKTGKRSPRIPQKPEMQEKIAQIKEIVTQKLTETTIPLETAPVSKQQVATDRTPIVLETKPSAKVDLAREETFFTKFERGLVNYWFFYLSVFLLTAGVIITVVFIVKEISSVNTQIIVIYSIGLVIFSIGETISLLSRRQRKKEKIKKELETEESSELSENKKDKFPLPAFGSVIVLIGLLVLYTAGIIGFGSLVSREVFIYISFGIAILTIGVGILNNSEMTTLAGYIPIITLVVLDLTWGGTPVLGEAEVFVALTIPVILAGVSAIFFKKWWGAVIMVTILPIIICIPLVSTRMGLEFFPLLLIPLTTLLITRYEKNVIPYTHKKILVFLSLIIPIIGLTIISFPSLNYLETEKPWARIYSVEIIITAIAILCISFFYQFIQEKYLNIKSKVCIFYYIGQGTIGIFSIVMVVLNRELTFGFVSSIIYFSFFFIVGCLGVIKAFKEKLTAANTIISFAIAEIQAIFMFTLFNISPNVQLGIQFFTAIIFTLLAITVTALSKWLNVSKYLFISWVVISAINNIIFIFVQKANYWFIFGSLAVFLILSLINKEPNKDVPNYVSQVSAGILSIIMILANLGNSYNIIFNVIFFVAFFVLGILSMIFKNYFTLIGTIISFSIAEVHAILLLSLFNITNTFQVVIYFIIGISFILLAITFIALNKKYEVSMQIFTTLIVFAVINVTILALFEKISIWLMLGAVLIFLILPFLYIKPNVDIPYYIGLGSIGVLTSILIGLNHANSMNYIFIIICFFVYFTIGILGLIKKLQKHYTLIGTLMSLVFAEITAILALIFINTTASNFQYAFYLLIAISFLVLSILAITLVKFIDVEENLYTGFIGTSLVNSILLLVLNKVSNWFAFAALILFFTVTAVELKPNTDRNLIIGKCAVGVYSMIMVLTTLSDPNNYIYNTVSFALFFVLGVVGLLNVLRKYFNNVGTYITIGIAEILAILLLILMNPLNLSQISFYFIIAISFNFIAMISIVFTKVFIRSDILLIGWIICSAINTMILGLSSKISLIFAFVSIILLMFLVTINNMPLFGERQEYWRTIALVTSVLALIVAFTLIFTGRLSYFPYEILIVFVVYVLANVPVFINWKREEVAILE